MIPLDWQVVVRGYADQAKRTSREPGADAPSLAEHKALVEKYGR